MEVPLYFSRKELEIIKLLLGLSRVAHPRFGKYIFFSDTSVTFRKPEQMLGGKSLCCVSGELIGIVCDQCTQGPGSVPNTTGK